MKLTQYNKLTRLHVTGSHYYVMNGHKSKPVEMPIRQLGVNIRNIDAAVTHNGRTYFIKVITSLYKNIQILN